MDEILIVDDSKLNRLALSEMLKEDYTIIQAASGKEMFEVLEKTDPKLILLDIIMPDLDGFEIIAKLKSSEEYNKIPVIFITGLDDSASEEKGLRLGALDYIAKPFVPNVVKARVRSYVQLYAFIRQAEILGQYDGLTGLYNKKTTELQIKKQLSSNPPLKNAALMIIDVDNFKSINDTFGHLYGDAVLTQLGSSLKTIFQKSDILGRVGGDEFFVFLRNYNDTQVIINRANDVCKEFNRSFEQNGHTVAISSSIGIATTEDATNFEQLYKFADIALYSAKSKGKNGFSFYSGEEDISYKSQRTEIENSKVNHNDPVENILDFKDNLKDYMFNLLEENKVVAYTIQSILQMICTQFDFESAYISKFDYEDVLIKCINNWMSSIPNIKPRISNTSFSELTILSNKFEDNNLVVSPAGAHDFQYSPTQANDKTICVFPLRNKKALLGYIAFETVASADTFNPKLISNIVDVCQQLSTVVTSQFLIENIRITKDNMVNILDAIKEPIYVTKPESDTPLFINKAAKDLVHMFHGKACFDPSAVCDDCILKNAIKNKGYFENEDATCRAVLWSNNSIAYMIKYKSK